MLNLFAAQVEHSYYYALYVLPIHTATRTAIEALLAAILAAVRAAILLL